MSSPTIWPTPTLRKCISHTPFQDFGKLVVARYTTTTTTKQIGDKWFVVPASEDDVDEERDMENEEKP